MTPRAPDGTTTDGPDVTRPEGSRPPEPPGPLLAGGGIEAGGGRDAGGDIIGMLATGLQFVGGAFGAADATVGLFGPVVLNPGLLLALAMDGRRGLAAYGELYEVGWAAGGTTLELAGDALTLAVEAAQLVAADTGFFTEPLTTVPLERAEGAKTIRRVELRAGAGVAFRGITVAAGAKVVVEYLDNGLVRVTVEGKLAAGVTADGNSAAVGPVGSASWLLANGRDASRLVLLLAAGGAGLPAALGVVTPIPPPQQVSAGLELSLKASVGPGGVPLAKGSLDAKGQVTFDLESGDRTYEFGVSASASTVLAEPILDALPADVRARLPGGALAGNLVEGSLAAKLSVQTDSANNVESVKLTIEGALGQGTGVDTPVGGASAAAGKKVVIDVTLDRQDLEALGPGGQRVLDALAQDRPADAVAALEALGGTIVSRADVDIDQYGYTKVDGNIAIEKKGTGADASAGATVETHEKSYR